MAQSRRIEKVSALIRKEMSQLLLNGIRDERVQTSLITITEVDLSGDLQHCKIFVSIFGEAIKQDEVFSGLEASAGFLRGELGRRLKLRRAPEVIFKLDKCVDKGIKVLGLLDQLEQERKDKEIPTNNMEA